MASVAILVDQLVHTIVPFNRHLSRGSLGLFPVAAAPVAFAGSACSESAAYTVK